MMIWVTSCHGVFKRDENDMIPSPQEGDTLELPYAIGNVSEISSFDDDKWFGNILTSITFFYSDTKGKIIDGTEVDCEFGDSLLDKIKECDEKLSAITSDVGKVSALTIDYAPIIREVKAKFKYNMGAILVKNEDSQYALSSNEDERGVEYEDIVTLSLKQVMFYFDEFSSMPLKYYEFEYDTDITVMNEYSNCEIETNMSSFKYKIDLLGNDMNETRAKYDGMIYSPTFREEYKLGMSMKENIDSDIYIDRGFSNAFEKHINLLGIKSLEAMEQFGNGFYNIKNQNEEA